MSRERDLQLILCLDHTGPQEGRPRPRGSSGAARGEGLSLGLPGTKTAPGTLRAQVDVNTCVFPWNHPSKGSARHNARAPFRDLCHVKNVSDIYLLLSHRVDITI